jgi:hypothetical protein
MPEPATKGSSACIELRAVLDTELNRLPSHYRAAIVLCDLEGKTRQDAARQLGCPEGTVAGHLARGRAMLARRLRRHGLGVSGGALFVLAHTASAVPPSAVSSTLALAGGAAPAKVAALAEGVIKAMLLTKLKAALAIVLMLGFMTTGATLACRTTGQEGKNPAVEKSVEPDAFTAWGNEVGGLQAGLGFRPHEKRAYHSGEMVTLVVRVRNVGKKDVNFSYCREFFRESPPAVTDDKSKPIHLEGSGNLGFARLLDVNLAPGQQITLCQTNLELRSASEKGKEDPVWKLFGTGKFQVQYNERVLSCTGPGGLSLDPPLSKLATGKLKLEVKSDLPPADQKKPGDKQEEAVTRWGKEVGGLQAGLGFRPGEHRAYRHGETVTLVVRLRNVGKQPIRFSYLQPFCEHALTVTGSDGEVALQPNVVIADLGQRIPGQVELQPGKEIELHELKRRLKPASASDGQIPEQPYALYGTGKISIQYEQVFGPPAFGVPGWRLDPALAKLATGNLEVQVHDDEDLTAWGEPVGGLQAGLMIRPEQLIYHYGDAITLSIRVRNVGKETVKFEYIRQFLDENPPTVTDVDNKAVPQCRLIVEGFHLPVKASLAPGEEIQLQSRLQGSQMKYVLTPADGTPRAGKVACLLGNGGNVGLQYERVFGDSSSGQIDIDRTLSKLGTGKLELLQVRSAAWGKEVEGLLCRLRADKMGDVPAFKLTVRDLGKRDLVIHKAEPFCEIEFDGTWYRWQGGVSIPAGTWPAGRRHDDFEVPVALGPRWRDGRGNPIGLRPGKHMVRVAYVTRDETPVRAVSNAVEIEIAVPRK